MGSQEQPRHRVAVIRVETPEDGDGHWRVDLFEVLPHAGGDRLVGRAADFAAACRMLLDWLREIADDAEVPER